MSAQLEMLRLQNHAKRDKSLRNELLAVRGTKDEYKSFCAVAAKHGYDIPLGELADMGAEFCDTMLRSQNGGGSYTFGDWYDFLGMFYDAIE
ncbi:MAG: hypothetical protein IJH37_06650 [Clostridia bacterium]|nr:hypothetical protein [Clostridia bacterium]